MGFPRSACRRAVELVGEVDDSTRLAASSEWLLQHVEFLFCQANGLSCDELEPANPWQAEAARQTAADDANPLPVEIHRPASPLTFPGAEHTTMGRPSGRGALTNFELGSFLHRNGTEHAGLHPHGANAFESHALVPRDFLSKQKKRWRKDQERRGLPHMIATLDSVRPLVC